VVSLLLGSAAMNRGRSVPIISQASPSPLLSATENTLASVVQPVEDTVTPPLPTVPPVKDLPSTAQAFIANFYAAYQAKDSDRLASYFTSDTTADLISLHSRLFKGTDPQGNPGGPTLFSSNSASEVVKSYVIITSAAQNSNWVITIKEQRLAASGQEVGEQTNLMTLVPVQGGTSNWQIDSYTHTGSSGKYNAFLLQ